MPPPLILGERHIGERHCFKCAEVAELDPVWRDRQTLYLQSIETAGIARKRRRNALQPQEGEMPQRLENATGDRCLRKFSGILLRRLKPGNTLPDCCAA